ncbi:MULTISPECIES: phosphonate ABC transporter ATP-binding protein [unclassified Gemella]|uniref:phosphonate ABC transporter ATP-binding protein n=1 Tax=unclassified Gemella TaxID=2624949 RepID=UPI001C04C6DB|nr:MULTISPECIES: phosphonate ABC transporter ATP-binding protein [unclassified Gemella]MBU0278481.1 phosphonate ABC transporter ATP-binding protein [Gemella sp. zg-1178]QWQ39478.1 phosphonate ABC transporter ATP-binding protein [Gemella sp. zg-570]
MNKNKLIVKNLSVNYNNKKVLNNLNFNVTEGDFVVILGKSGAGKTTLLRCINKLNNFTGYISIDEININTLNNRNLNEIRKKIAFIFQDYNILDNLYTIENVMLPFLSDKNIVEILFNIYKKDEYNLALKYLDKVGLTNEAFIKSKYLSGGQKQRVAIAKAICQKPSILLADEPVSSLDIKNTEEIMNLFATLNNKKNMTILMNLHDVEIAKKYSHKIIGIKSGNILFYKNTEDVTDNEITELYR